MEDHVYILDYLPYGKYSKRSIKRKPLAYGLGEKEFKILELEPKADAEIRIDERAYIGKDLEKRKKILHVKRRMDYSNLPTTGKNEIPYVVREIAKMNEDRFVNFFNKAEAISRKYHALQLLPGIGRKTMWKIIDERKKSPFTSFEDLKERVPTLSNPIKCVSERIITEMEDPSAQRYLLFVSR